jgi:peptidylprolyl isomerase
MSMLKVAFGLGIIGILGFAGLLISGMRPPADIAAQNAVATAPAVVAEVPQTTAPVEASPEDAPAEQQATADAQPQANPEFAFDPAIDYGLEIDIAGEANGTLVVDLFEEVAPLHVEQIITIANAGEYDNIVFHRVIDGFMAQTGDVENGVMGMDLTRAGTGNSDLPDIPAEFSDLPFERGVLGMARTQDPNSANSQFFIMFEPGYFLNGQYTVVGQVTSGMDIVDQIKRGTGANGAVIGAPDMMAAVRVTP